MINALLIKLIRFYQKWISPLKRPTCRFLPTCSSYAIESIEKHGSTAGLYLTIKRLLRCHPFCDGGFDPVPKTRV